MTDFSVYFNKYVNVRDNVEVTKDFDVRAFVKGTSAVADATADALGHNSSTETLTQTTAVEGVGSSSVSQSISLATKAAHDFHHNW
jgi:hypothetical protein